MKRFLILNLAALAVALLICTTVGCAGKVQTYADPSQTIDDSVNQEFVIAPGSNPTTGYSWQETYNETMLKLIDKTYKPGEEANVILVGAGGVEFFQFTALKKGGTEINFVYKREWEEGVIEEKVFSVNVQQ